MTYPMIGRAGVGRRGRRYVPAWLAGLITAWSVFASCAGLAAGSSDPVATVTTAAVVRKTLEDTLVVYGQVQADPDYVVNLTPPSAGLVAKVAVRLGQRVAAGDRILSLDTAPDTRAQYLQAKAAVDYANSQLASTRRLRQEQLATRDQLQSAQRSLTDARSKLDSLKQVGAGQKSSEFRSPFAGVVTALNISPGDRVQANTAVALLAQEDRLIVTLGIEPEDARRVADSTRVTVTSIFDRSIHFEGRISAVHALVNPSTRLIDVIVPVPDRHTPTLVLNSTVRGEIALSEKKALVVPREALLRDGDKAYVFRVSKGHAERIDVTVDTLEGSQVGVSGALSVDDTVITSGSYQVQDGMAVRVRGS